MDNGGIGCFGIFDLKKRKKQIKSNSKTQSKTSEYPLFQPVAPRRKRRKVNGGGSSSIGHSIVNSDSHTQKVGGDASNSREVLVQNETLMNFEESRNKTNNQMQQTAILSFFQNNSKPELDSSKSKSNSQQVANCKNGVVSTEMNNASTNTVSIGEQKKIENKNDNSQDHQKEDGPMVQHQCHKNIANCSLSLSTPNKNITSLLQHRSINSNRRKLFSDSGYHGMRRYVQKHWSICEAIELGSDRNQREITAMKFDSEGILLAVGDIMGFVQIFDFDEINAAGVSTMNQSRKDEGDTRNTKKRNLAPFISFRAGNFRISCISWNPHNENLLVVSFFNSNEVRVFDISSSSNNGPLFIRLVDANERHNSRSNGSTALNVIQSRLPNKSKVFVGGLNGVLKLWEIPSTSIKKSSQKHCTLIWSMNTFNQKITEITYLHSDTDENESNGLIMVATAYGSFALFDIHKCARKSFSSAKTPQKLKMWSLSREHRDLKNHLLPSRDWMGVNKCFIRTIKTSQDLMSTQLKKMFEICVCLNSGWVMSMRLDLCKNNGCWQVLGPGPSIKVIHRPSSVRFYSSEGNELLKAHPPVCVPEFPTPAIPLDKASSLLMIADVRPVKIMLPNTDKRVLGIKNTMTREGDCDHIIVINQGENLHPMDDKVSKISLPNGKLKNMTIHPDNEWVVVFLSKCSGTSNSLKLMRLNAK